MKGVELRLVHLTILAMPENPGQSHKQFALDPEQHLPGFDVQMNAIAQPGNGLLKRQVVDGVAHGPFPVNHFQTATSLVQKVG